MNIAVMMRAVPDPVEELELNSNGTDLERDFLGYILNEFDDHALEEALLLKEEAGGTVTAIALGTADEVTQMLHTAVAKGAGAALKLGDGLEAMDAHAQAELFANAVKAGSFDVVLCGVQASDELDGQVGMLVAATLGWPHVSVVVGARPLDGGLRVTKEYWAGITAEFGVSLPVVLGVQAARKPPRYVAVAKIREAQQSGALTEVDVNAPTSTSGVVIKAMRIPETGEGAEMISGDETAAAARIAELIRGAR
jgi:electron transfer flavoprotein beta subunit